MFTEGQNQHGDAAEVRQKIQGGLGDLQGHGGGLRLVACDHFQPTPSEDVGPIRECSRPEVGEEMRCHIVNNNVRPSASAAALTLHPEGFRRKNGRMLASDS